MGDREILPARVQNVLDMEIVRLNLWTIQFNEGCIKLEGFVRSDDGNSMQRMCSKKIARVMNATMLFDVSGRFFELSGQIDRASQAKMGMPSKVIDEFVNGFPENWSYHIKTCLPVPQSAFRPIQAAPREPLRNRNEPIVTLADETEMNERPNSALEREKKRKEEQRKRMEREEMEERKRKEEEEARKREEEEEEERNTTLRIPLSQTGEAITPIRYKRGNPGNNVTTRSVFQKTPVRTKKQSSGGPLAASTPQPSSDRRSSLIPPEEESIKPEVKAPTPKGSTRPPPQEYASDSELFAVPKLPPPKKRAGLDFLTEMESFFDNAVIGNTPAREKKAELSPIRNSMMTSSRGGGYSDFEEGGNMSSRMSRRDGSFRRDDGGRDESRMSRKRGHYDSPDRYDHQHRRRYDPREENDSDWRYDSKRSRHRETSISSGRSVRFDDDYRRGGPPSRDDYEDYSRSFHRNSGYSRDYDRGSSGDDQRKLNDILRREAELMNKLQNNPSSSSHKSKSRRPPPPPVNYSSDEEEEDHFNMDDEWERENQEMMDNSMIFDGGNAKNKRGNGGANRKKNQSISRPKPRAAPKPSSRKPSPPQKKKKTPTKSIDLNDSIASNRPRRSCVTPSTPAPKRITWPKRDLDKLKHVLDLTKPKNLEEDWMEVTRLLAKEGVDADIVKQTAINKLKWKEPVQVDQSKQDEEKEKKRRRVGLVREGVRMHEELMNGGGRNEEEERNDLRLVSMDDYQPEDVAADQSLLALGTPLPQKGRGGTRGSIMPRCVEDSPMAKGNSSGYNSPRLDQTKAKEVETTLKYVQHLSMMQARPASSRANNTTLTMNKTSGRASKNTSLSLEQGQRKAMKMINRGRTINEEDEYSDSDDEEEDEMEGTSTSFY